MAKGRKTGGRRRGVPNKATAARQALVAASGDDPLTYLLAVMRDPKEDPHRRFEAAKAGSALRPSAADGGGA